MSDENKLCKEEISAKICDPGTGSVSPVSDIDYTIYMNDPSFIIQKTFELHKTVFNIDLAKMFDVNYYGTNFILKFPDGKITFLNQSG